MMFKPSALEQYIATLPQDLQIDSLNAIKEEHDRWKRGDLTPKEKDSLKLCGELGENMAITMENVALEVLGNEETISR